MSSDRAFVRASNSGKSTERFARRDANHLDASGSVKTSKPKNAMTIDVEEHFQVSAFENHIRRQEWGVMPSRVSRNVDRILEKLEEYDAQATFFTLGCVAERAPEVVRSIVGAGHEIASHGYRHVRVNSQTPKQFLDDVSKTKKLLEDISGEEVIGYRAASFSIGPDTPWAHEVLKEAGYRYSSSIYPIKHDHYGYPKAPRFPFRFADGGLLEIPLTTTTVAGRNWPGAGGGYFRLLPTAYSRWAIRRVNYDEHMPAVFYFHPWEIDPDQPRVTGLPLKTRFRHYVNLDRFESRLISILRDMRWGRMDEIYRDAF